MTGPKDTVSDPLDELRQLWMKRGEPPPVVDATALQRASQRLRRRVWIRNLTEWGAAVLLVPLCARGLLGTERLMTRLGLLCIGLAGLYVSATLYRRGRVGRQPESASTAEFLHAHVTALERQAQLLEAVWRWYLLPFVPGITLVYLDAALAALTLRGDPRAAGVWLTVAGGWLLTSLLFLGVAALNRRGARDLRREIAAIGAPEVLQQGLRQ